MTRERKPTNRYKPVNYVKERAGKPKPKPKNNAQSSQVIDPNAPIPAIHFDNPRVPITQDNPLQQVKSLSKKYRNARNYKLLRKIDDDISKDLVQAFRTLEFNQYSDERYKFTIIQKMDEMSESIDPKINGPNSFTNEIYAFDLTQQQYNNLYYLNKPTLEEIRTNKYIGGKVNNDTPTYYTLKSIIDKTIQDRYDSDLTWMLVNHRAIILDMLMYRFNHAQSLSTFWGDIRALARLCKICVGEEHELYKKLSMLATDFNIAIIIAQEGRNKLSKYEQRTFLPFGMLLDMVEDMHKKFKDLLQERGKDGQDVYKYHMYTLILMSYLYTPPVRLEMNNMKITRTM
eukprot:503438-Hanusia_phi.AAC.1